MVVEGYTDVLALVQAGVRNVVASMGTALTDAQIGLMMRFTSNVTFMFDADRAGTEAMLRSGELARNHSLRPMVAVLPGGQDPADVAVKGGEEAIGRVWRGKMSLLGFELRQALARGDTSSSDGRVRVFEEVRGIMGRASSLKEREEEIPLVADRLRLDDKEHQATARRVLASTSRPSAAEEPARRRAAHAEPACFLARGSIERDFLVAAACNPEQAVPLLETLTPEHFSRPQQPGGLHGAPRGFHAS